MSKNDNDLSKSLDPSSPGLLVEYLKEKALGHKSYKVYTDGSYQPKLDRLYLSTGIKWNDVKDRESFNPENSQEIRFGRCFSFSKSENVAMWMLYGGLQKKGIMIDYPPSVMKEAIKSPSIEIGYFQGKDYNSIGTISDKFELFLIDMIYCSMGENYRVKRGDEICDETKTMDLFSQTTYFMKGYPWHYENECRLIATIDQNYLHQIIHDKNLENNIKICDLVVKLDISKENQKGLKNRMYCAPNNKTNEYKCKTSKLVDTIDWSLCDMKCQKSQSQGNEKSQEKVECASV